MSDSSVDFVLEPNERHSAVWARLLAYFEQRLNELRVKNDNPADELRTAALRGEIRMLKSLIALDKGTVEE